MSMSFYLVLRKAIKTKSALIHEGDIRGRELS
jgi:hypothetical protein